MDLAVALEDRADQVGQADLEGDGKEDDFKWERVLRL